MTPEHCLALIIATIRAIQIGTPVPKGYVMTLLALWPDLSRDAMHREGGAGSTCSRPPLLGSSALRRSDQRRPGHRSTRTCRSVQHVPSRPVPDPDGGERLRRNSPGQANREPAAGDRDHKFPAGYPSLKEEGAVSRAENIRPTPPETNCDLDKSGRVARDRYQESRCAIRIGGVGVRERGIPAPGPWDPPPLRFS